MSKEKLVREKIVSAAGVGRWFALILFTMLLYPVCYGQQPNSTRSVGSSTQKSLVSVNAERSDGRYRIGPGDLLSITTLDYPQLSSDSTRVDSNGMILLPLVDGEVEAACRTEGELAQEITKRYLKYIREPQVKVFVKDYQSQNVAVIGAVNTPGRFQLQRRVRLLELLAFVGGPSSQAGRSVQIFHAGSSVVCGKTSDVTTSAQDDASGSQLVAVNLNATLRGEQSANPYVVAGDIITVPDAEQYFILGNVAKPSAYPLKEKMSITQAIVIAGGTLADTNTEHIRILRQKPGASVRDELVVDLKQAMKTGATETFLEPNDIVEVPKKGGFSVGLKNVFRTMVPTLANLPLRVIY
jgi:polysaccharide biosynthesis/export protein